MTPFPLRSRAAIRAGVSSLALLLGATAVPAFAQITPAPADQPQSQAAISAQQPGQNPDTVQTNDVVVTGTLFRRTNTETPSPVTVLSADDLEKRGAQTVQSALQALSSINGPALTNSFTANGAFAGGASGASLRGLTTNSTLVLFDGLRAAFYPLADDGTRNFVDLNTIPDEIVERVEVLKDGASSTYGADAVAGVINIITKKTLVGLHATAEAGISQRGDAGNHRLSLSGGYGDLDTQGFNVYLSAHYVDSDPLYNRDRSYPFNTANQSGICYQGNCGPNNIVNGTTNGAYNGLGSTTAFVVRPYVQNGTSVTQQTLGASLGGYQLLNGCQGLTPYTLTAADRAANPTAPATVCQQDRVKQFGQIEPLLRRGGVSGHLAAKIGERAELTGELNYENSYTFYTGSPSAIVGSLPPGIDFPTFSTSSGSALHSAGSGVLALPVYVCPRGTAAACTAANGTLNPNNPFASLGEVARLVGVLPTSITSNATKSEVYRAALSLDGTFGENWGYSLSGTAMRTNLKTTANGYVFAQHLLDEVSDGSYNFINPSQTSAAALSYLTPTQIIKDNSQLYQVQGSVTKEFLQLPGGMLGVAVGGAFRHESVNDASGNPDYNGPTNRYFTLNAFGAVGQRDVESAYFEIKAPILTQLEVTGSGRYDHYSTGQSNFSPKIGAKFTPIPQFSLRGTFSRGFRIPSFAEANALPTTGYVTVSAASLPASFTAGHLNANGSFDPYLTAYSVGETTVGNPNLKPEKSRNFTVGAIIEPIRRVSFTVDYYNIRKTNAITAVNFASALTNYYTTGSLNFNGVTIVPDAADQTGVPANVNSRPRVAFAQGSYINANTIETSGIDAGVRATFPIASNVKFTTVGEATYIFYLNTSFPDGHTEHYAGTLGNFNLTAGTGTPRWKANWQNTLDIGNYSFTATAYYTSGYNYSAEDQGSVAGDCSLVPTNNSGAAYQPCDVRAAVFVDAHGELRLKGGKFVLYGDVLNVGGSRAPIDATTYGAYLYNPVVGDEGILGRTFRVGAKVNF